MLIAAAPAWAQNSNGILIILNNGDSIRSNYVGINNNHSLLKGPHVQLNPDDKNQRLRISEVKSIEGFDPDKQTYRYFRRLDYPNNNTLAERSIKTERIEAYYFDSFYQSGMYGGGYNWRHLHYSKDGAPLKKAEYANLKRDLSDNPEALAHLHKANSLRITQFVMYGLGTALIIAGISKLVNERPGPGYQEDPGVDKTLVLGVMGAVMLRIPFFLNNPKRDHMTKALEAY